MSTPRRLADRYELSELIGLGGMSEVHLARDLRLHRDVAVKLLRADLALDPNLNERFQREARDSAALNHPAIAAIYDTGEVQTPDGPLPYIVMEYVDGVTLRDVLRGDEPLPPHRALGVIARVCEALNFSHQRGIIHRDVKPANIMIGAAGSVKIVDFGIAKALAGNEQSSTETGTVMGTAQYLSPEQARGDRVDARADVYSLGCVLYELVTGEPPFVGDSPVAVAYQHVRRQPIAPSARNGEISPDVDAVVLKAMAKNPDNRYQTAAEMRSDLLRLQRGQTPGAPAPSEPPSDVRDGTPAPQLRRRSVRRWLTAAAVLGAIAVAAVVGVGVARDHRDAVGPDVHVSPGPESNPIAPRPVESVQLTVPDVSSLTYVDAVRRLTDAGFGRFQQAFVPSSSEQRDRVLITNPAADRVIAATSEITIVVGSGPAIPTP